MIQAGNRLRELKLLQGLFKRNGDLLFALVEAHGDDPQGRPLLPYALLRGPAVVIVPEIIAEETGESFWLLVSQRRMGHGRMVREFPAGMLDEKLHDPMAVAMQELFEETGLKVPVTSLIPLWEKPLYSSPGLSDESIFFVGVRITMPQAALKALHGAEQGHHHEGEFIDVSLASWDDPALDMDSLQSLLGRKLFLEKRHLIPNTRIES